MKRSIDLLSFPLDEAATSEKKKRSKDSKEGLLTAAVADNDCLFLQLGAYGPLSYILTFLNAKDLSRAECTCRMVKSLTPLAWELLAENTVGTLQQQQHHHVPWKAAAAAGVVVRDDNHDDYQAARNRACRYYKAQDYAARMELVAADLYDYDDRERCHVKCCSWATASCKCKEQDFPKKLATSVFRVPRNSNHNTSTTNRRTNANNSNNSKENNEKYDFFLRFSYRKPPPKTLLASSSISSSGSDTGKNSKNTSSGFAAASSSSATATIVNNHVSTSYKANNHDNCSPSKAVGEKGKRMKEYENQADSKLSCKPTAATAAAVTTKTTLCSSPAAAAAAMSTIAGNVVVEKQSLLIWEGFVPGTRKGNNEIFFDMQNIYKNKRSSRDRVNSHPKNRRHHPAMKDNWQSMHAFLQAMALQQQKSYQSSRIQNANSNGANNSPEGSAFFFTDTTTTTTTTAAPQAPPAASAAARRHDDEDASDEEQQQQQEDLLALLYEAMDNLAVTVVALDRTVDLLTKPSLVVATGGFNDNILLTSNAGGATDEMEAGDNDLVAREFQLQQQIQRDESIFVLNPRNVQTHGVDRDEDYISVELSTVTTFSTAATTTTTTNNTLSTGRPLSLTRGNLTSTLSSNLSSSSLSSLDSQDSSTPPSRTTSLHPLSRLQSWGRQTLYQRQPPSPQGFFRGVTITHEW